MRSCCLSHNLINGIQFWKRKQMGETKAGLVQPWMVCLASAAAGGRVSGRRGAFHPKSAITSLQPTTDGAASIHFPLTKSDCSIKSNHPIDHDMKDRYEAAAYLAPSLWSLQMKQDVPGMLGIPTTLHTSSFVKRSKVSDSTLAFLGAATSAVLGRKVGKAVDERNVLG